MDSNTLEIKCVGKIWDASGLLTIVVYMMPRGGFPALSQKILIVHPMTNIKITGRSFLAMSVEKPKASMGHIKDERTIIMLDE